MCFLISSRLNRIDVMYWHWLNYLRRFCHRRPYSGASGRNSCSCCFCFQKCLWLLCFTSDWGEIWHSCSSSKYTSIYRVGFSIWLILSRWWSRRHFTQKSAATWWSAGGASARRLCSSSIQYSFNEKLTERKFLIYSTFYTCFLARDSIYAIARYIPSPVCLSVRPSVCPSHGWISQRRLKLGSRNLHHRVAPWL